MQFWLMFIHELLTLYFIITNVFFSLIYCSIQMKFQLTFLRFKYFYNTKIMISGHANVLHKISLTIFHELYPTRPQKCLSNYTLLPILWKWNIAWKIFLHCSVSLIFFPDRFPYSLQLFLKLVSLYIMYSR